MSPPNTAPDAARIAEVHRATKETTIDVVLDVDGSGATDVSTGLPFFDHMINQLGRHGGFDLTVSARGDLDVDAHHTVEDVGISVGEAVSVALGEKAGIRRFGSVSLPLDEALVEVALDLSGRPFLVYDIQFPPDTIALGTPPFDPQLAEEFWRAFATAAGLTLHIRLRTGKNTHHIVEASFKGVARALRDAVSRQGGASPQPRGACDLPPAPTSIGGPSQATGGPPVIAVLDYGIGNLRSAEKALQHLGADAALVDDPDRAAAADGVVLPGVGAFGRCAQALRSSGLGQAARFAIDRGVPFLGICVGFQLLYEGSDEDPSEPGLGILRGAVRRLPEGVKAPQMQWNILDIRADRPSRLLSGLPAPAWVYFVHSFAPERTADTSATCDYGGQITASAEAGTVWGTQFHPEKSGAVGLRILGNFVDAVAAAVT